MKDEMDLTYHYNEILHIPDFEKFFQKTRCIIGIRSFR